jgi:endonuclease YncB( thermonuclease family)
MGRLVCMVLVDGTDAGLEMLKKGLAWVYDAPFDGSDGRGAN